jgi:hypothetical protein
LKVDPEELFKNASSFPPALVRFGFHPPQSLVQRYGRVLCARKKQAGPFRKDIYA